MKSFRLLKKLRRGAGAVGRSRDEPPASRRKRKLSLEPLEDRVLLSADPLLAASVFADVDSDDSNIVILDQDHDLLLAAEEHVQARAGDDPPPLEVAPQFAWSTDAGATLEWTEVDAADGDIVVADDAVAPVQDDLARVEAADVSLRASVASARSSEQIIVTLVDSGDVILATELPFELLARGPPASDGSLYLHAATEPGLATTGTEDGSGVLALSPSNSADSVDPLSQEALARVAAEAIRVWFDSGLFPDRVGDLSDVRFEIADLPGGALGETNGALVVIDATAAGYGWSSGPAEPSSDRMDLLTVVLHELGHVLGLEHQGNAGELMAEALLAGQRLLPTDALGDATLADLASLQGAALLVTPLRPLLFIPGFAGAFAAPDVESSPGSGVFDEWSAAALDDWYLNLGRDPADLTLEPVAQTYDDLLQSFDNIGYTPDTDLFTVLWDWRVPIAVPEGDYDSNSELIDGLLDSFSAQDLFTDIGDGIFDTGLHYLAYFLDLAVSTWTTDNGGVAPDGVDIVTHSTGGLLARSYLQSSALGGSYNGQALPGVHNLVQIAVPNQGLVGVYSFLQNDFSYDSSTRVGGLTIGAAWERLGDGATITRADGTTFVQADADAQSDPQKWFIDQYVSPMQDLLAVFPNAFDDGGGLGDLNEARAGFESELLLDLNFSSASNWVNALNAGGVATIVYGDGVETRDQMIQKTGRDPNLSLLEQEILPFTDYIGTFPSTGTVWYHGAGSNPSGPEGDGTVPVLSASGGFGGEARANIVAISSDHSGLVHDEAAQSAIILAAVGASPAAGDLSTSLKRTQFESGLTLIDADVVDLAEFAVEFLTDLPAISVVAGTEALTSFMELALGSLSELLDSIPQLTINTPLGDLVLTLDVTGLQATARLDITIDQFFQARGDITLRANFASELIDIATGLPANLVTAFATLASAIDDLVGGIGLSAAGDLSSIDDVPYSSVELSATNVTIFAGLNGPYWEADLNGDGIVDPNEIDPDAAGIQASNVQLGAIFLTPSFLVTQVFPTFPSLWALQATATSAGLVGMDGVLEASIQNLVVRINNGESWRVGPVELGPPVVDFTKTFESTPGAGDGSRTIGPLTLDYDGNQRIAAESPSVLLQLASFVHVTGSLSFQKGPTQIVDVATGLPANLGALVNTVLVGLQSVIDGLILGDASVHTDLTAGALQKLFDAGLITSLTPIASELQAAIQTWKDDGNLWIESNLSKIYNVEVGTLQIGTSGAHAFIGLNGPYGQDLDGDGDVGDDSDGDNFIEADPNGDGDTADSEFDGAVDPDSVGLVVDGLDLAFVAMEPTLSAIPGLSDILPKFHALKATAGFAGLVGLDDLLEAELRKVLIEINDGTAWPGDLGPPVVDFANSPSLASEIVKLFDTGGDGTISVLELKTASGLPSFAGLFGATDPDDAPVDENDIIAALDTGAPGDGVLDLTEALALLGASGLVPADFDRDSDDKLDPVGYEVGTGAGGPIYIDYDGNQRIGASAKTVLLQIANFVHVTGSLSFEKGPTQIVDVATGLPANLGDLADVLLTELQSAIDGLILGAASTLTDLSAGALQELFDAGLIPNLTPSDPVLQLAIQQWKDLGNLWIESNLSKIHNLEVATMQIGAAGVHAFLGLNGPYGRDLDDDGDVGDDSDGDNIIEADPNGDGNTADSEFDGAVAPDAIGLVVDGLNVGFVALEPTLNSLPGLSGLLPKFHALKATAGFAGLVGIDEFLAASLRNILIEVNDGEAWPLGLGPPVVDFANSPSLASEIVKLFDTSGDGTISVLELKTASGLTSFPGLFEATDPDGAPVDENDIIAALDTGAPGDGVLDLTEALALLGASVLVPVDFDADGDGKLDPVGFEVRTGSGTPIYIDFDGNQRIGAAADSVLLQISEFVHVIGSFSFEKGPTHRVDIATGFPPTLTGLLQTVLSNTTDYPTEGTIGLGPDALQIAADFSRILNVEVDSLQIGTLDAHAFIGVDGPYKVDSNGDGSVADEMTVNENAIGLVIDDFDLGFVTMAPTLASLPGLEGILPKFTALKATAGTIAFVGIDEFTVAMRDLMVDVNKGTRWPGGIFGAPSIDFAASFPSELAPFFDEDGDLSIEIEDLRNLTGLTAIAGLYETGDPGGDPLLPEDLIEQFDTNGNGVLELGEAEAILDVGVTRPAAGFDKDSDGKLDLAGFEVRTGTTTAPVYIDHGPGQIIRASVANVQLSISSFVHISGSFAFEQGEKINVALAGGVFGGTAQEISDFINDLGLPAGTLLPNAGDSALLNLMTVAASNVHAFVGYDGDASDGVYWFDQNGNGLLEEDPNGDGDFSDSEFDLPVDPDAIGIVIDDLDVGLAIMTPTELLAFGKYIALTASAQQVSFVGVPGFTLTATQLKLQVNQSTPNAFGISFLPVVDFASSFESEIIALFDTSLDGVITVGELRTLSGLSELLPLFDLDDLDTDEVSETRLLEVLDALGNSNERLEAGEALALLGASALVPTDFDDDTDGQLDPTGLELATGNVPIYLAMEGALTAIEGFVELDVFSILTLTGSIAFELGPSLAMPTLTDGSVHAGTLSTMTIGGADIYGFVGWDGPYFLDGGPGSAAGNGKLDRDTMGNPLAGEVATSAKGLALNELNAGMFLGVDVVGLATFFALDLSVGSIELVGLPPIEAIGIVDVQLNLGGGVGSGLAAIDFSGLPGGKLDVNAGAGNVIPLTFDSVTVQVLLAGTLTVPDIVELLGVVFFEVDGTSFNLFATGGLKIGPAATQDLLAITGSVVAVINGSGFAADVAVSINAGVPGVLELSGAARLLINTTSAVQEFELPDRLVDFLQDAADGGNSLAQDTLDRLGPSMTGMGPGLHFVMIGAAAPNFGTAGTPDLAGARALLGLGGGVTQFDPIPGPYVAAVIVGGFSFVNFIEASGTGAISLRAGALEFLVELSFDFGDGLHFGVVGSLGIFNDGIRLSLTVTIDINILSLFDVSGTGTLEIDTTGSNNFFRVSIDNPTLSILSVFRLSATNIMFVVNNGAWLVSFTNAGIDFFVFSLRASGFFSSSGSFSLTITGHVDATIAGTGIVADFTMNVALDADRPDPRFSLSMDVSGSGRIAGVNVGGGRATASLNLGIGPGLPLTGSLRITLSGTGSVIKFIEGVLSFFASAIWGHEVDVSLSVTIFIGTIRLPGALVPATPPPPRLAGPLDKTQAWDGNLSPDGILYLNVGDRADARNATTGSPTETEEAYSITVVSTAGNGSQTVRISAFGSEEEYAGVRKIMGDFGGDDDTLTTSNLAVDLDVAGGTGVDRLFYNGTGHVVMYGDNRDGTGTASGADALQITGTPMAGSALWGGPGADELDNRTAVAVALRGEAGNDVLRGGSADDPTLEGGPDNDRIFGGPGNDVATGGSGLDVVIEAAADLGLMELFDGGSQDDQILITGSATDQFFRVEAAGDRIRISLYDPTGTTLLGQLEGISVQELGLVGGGGNDRFELIGALDVGGITKQVLIDGGTGQDELSITLAGTDDQVNLIDFDATLPGGVPEDISLATWIGHYEIGFVTRSDGDKLRIDAAGGNDLLNASGTDDDLFAEVTLIGGSGNDIIIGTPSADIIDGGSGDDRLSGLLGTDTFLDASGTNDVLFEWDASLGGGLDYGLYGNKLVTGSATVTGSGELEVVSSFASATVEDIAGIFESVILIGGSGANTFGLGTAGASIQVNGAAEAVTAWTGPVVLNGVGGNDRYYVEYAGLGAATVSILEDAVLIDVDGDGAQDVNEDADADRRLDPGEDLDADGRLDAAEELRMSGGADDRVVVRGTGIGEDLDAATNGANMRFVLDESTLPTVEITVSPNLELSRFHLLGGADRVALRDLNVDALIDGGADSDTFHLGSNASFVSNTFGVVHDIDGVLELQGGSGASDVLIVDETGDGAGHPDTELTATTLTGLDMAGGLTFGGFETVDLNLGTGTDALNIRSSALGTLTTVRTGPGTGIDTVNIGSLAPGVGGNVNAIQGLIVVTGQSSGNETINVDDTGDMGSNVGELTSGAITGLGMTQGIQYSGMNFINVSLGSGTDTFSVLSTHVGGTTVNSGGGADVINVRTIAGATAVNGQGGNDTINVGSNAQGTLAAPTNNSGGHLNAIGATLTIDGGADGDTMTVDDTGDMANNTGVLTNSRLTGLGLATMIDYVDLEVLDISLGSGADTFTIDSTHNAASVGIETTTLHGGAGGDTIHINDASDTLTVNGEADGDTINVNGTSAASHSFLNGDADNDIFNVHAMGGPVDIDGGANDDTVNVGDQAPQLPVGARTLPVGSIDLIDALLTASGGDGTADVINIDDSAAPITNDKNGTLTATTLRGLDLPEGIDYDTFEAFSLWLGFGDNEFVIDGTHAGTTTVHSAMGADRFEVNDASGAVILNGEQGADIFDIRGTDPTSTLTVNGHEDNDIFTVSHLAPARAPPVPTDSTPGPAVQVGSIDAIDGLIVVHGGTQDDVLYIDDSASLADKIGTLTSSTLRGLGMPQGIDYDELEDLNLWLGAGADRLLVSSTHAATTQIQLGDGPGGVDDVDDSLLVTSVAGVTTVHGQAGNDRFYVNVVPSAADLSGTPLRTHGNGIAAVLNLHGEGDSDRTTIHLAGDDEALINVFDNGAPDDGVDTLIINGADDPAAAAGDNDDLFLLRKGFVALLNDVDGDHEITAADKAERVNYDENINARLVVNGERGDDAFFVDDNSAITTIDGGVGEDFFQIGQVFGLDRTTAANIDAADVFDADTVAAIIGVVSDPTAPPGSDPIFNPSTDLLDQAAIDAINQAIVDAAGGVLDGIAYLSRGVSHATTVFGGDGDDIFSVYHNVATLRLEGEDDNDEFIVRAFVVLPDASQSGVQGDTEVSGGEGADLIQYAQNAPVSIDGGDGFDKVVVLGTAFPDAFVVTRDGIFGAGLAVFFTNVESAELDTLEGDDDIFVLSTHEDLVTTVIGGLGSDHIRVLGDVTRVIRSTNVFGRSGFITHEILPGGDILFGTTSVPGIPVTVSAAGVQLVEVATNGDLRVTEDGSLLTSYEILLTDPLAADFATVYLTVSAGLASSADRVGGGRSLLIGTSETGPFDEALVLTFDTGNSPNGRQTIWVKAAPDAAAEGERVALISHSINSTSASYDNLVLADVFVTIVDDDQPALDIRELDIDTLDPADVMAGIVDLSGVDRDDLTRVLEGDFNDIYAVALTVAPAAGEIVTITFEFDAGQLALDRTMLTFDDGNWDQFQLVGVSAVQEGAGAGVAEAVDLTRITHRVATTGGLYDSATDGQRLFVTVFDDETAGVILTPSDGSTHVVEGGDTDSYTLQLTRAPAAGTTVTLRIAGDGQTLLSSLDPRFSVVTEDAATNTFEYDVAFGPTDWNDPLEIVVAANPAFVPTAGERIAFAPADQLLGKIAGPLIVEGGVGEGKDRSLVAAVGLPGENTEIGNADSLTPDESTQIDTLTVFNSDSTNAVDTGFLVDRAGSGIENDGLALTDLGMGGDLMLDRGTGGVPDPVIFGGGVTYNELEILEILLGKGVDLFTIDATADGTTTVVHGGGAGDHFTINDRGNGPLVIYGDTSPSGIRYSNDTAGPSEHGTPFDNPGSDTIDASATPDQADGFVGIVVFGGPGDDIIHGTQDDDHLAGGAGNDRIFGEAGNDHLYGDSTFEVDLASLFTEPAAIITVITTETPGDDELHGGSGRDVLFGDHGRIAQSDGVLRITTTEQIALIETANPTVGGNDQLFGDADDDRLFGGQGGDHIEGGGDQDIAFGDLGRLLYDVDADLSTLDIIEIPDPTIGAADVIFGDAGEDLLIGGVGGDFIDGDADDDLIFGDSVGLELQPGGDISNARYQTLVGTLLYTRGDLSAGPGPSMGQVLVDGTPRDFRNLNDPDGAPWWAGMAITELYHSAAIEAGGVAALVGSFGDDYIAGGGGNDSIFGQLGNDTIQGDGSIDGALDPQSPNPVGFFRTPEQLALTPTLSVLSRGPHTLTPSFEAATDGDDYVEGGGGDDLIFGNLGQDDIVGGSSSLFTLDTPGERPDGADVIFGGAGTRIERNHVLTMLNGDTILLDSRHARDSDAIAGDNANIYRVVGTNGSDSAALLRFDYDEAAREGYDPNLPIVVRAVELLDYTPGGPDYVPSSSDIGAADEIHGESGDDFVYGMVADDVLFGDSEDDDLIGGWGADWISGGTGSDGVLGDDGRIFTGRYRAGSTSAFSEPLNGIHFVAQVNQLISSPGNIQQAIINPAGALVKQVDLTPFDLNPAALEVEDPEFDPAFADDILYGGLGDDFVHGGAGDDAISGTEATQSFFDRPASVTGAGGSLRFDPTRVEFADYDEIDPRSRITPFFLDFEELLPGGLSDEDKLFGDLGNDWIVGGPDNDNLWGGRGHDLLNADDDLSTNGGLNDMPDPPNFEIQDRAFGGAGRDVLIANTGGDRLIDWAGEFNSYLVPFAPFGLFTISRGLPPKLFDFLYDLGRSDGADPTRAAETGSAVARAGEPHGELGLVTQKDPGWQDQSGAPNDPQPGNIPGGPRLTLRGVDFNAGTTQAFAVDSGSFQATGGRLEVSKQELATDFNNDDRVDLVDFGVFKQSYQNGTTIADTNGDGVVNIIDFGQLKADMGSQESLDAASVFHVGEYLPTYFEIEATINAAKPTGGIKANSYLIFDYHSPTDFRFAGVNISTNKIEMGHHDGTGWQVDVWTPAQLKADRDYRVLLAINGLTATFVVDGNQLFSHSFDPRVDADGFTYGLNAGMVGIGGYNSVSRLDDLEVRILKPEITFEDVEDFTDGVADLLTGFNTGLWSLDGSRFDGTPGAGQEFALQAYDLAVGPNSVLELEGRLTSSAFGGFFFDYYGPQDYKFAAISPSANEVVIGHWQRGSVKLDASAAIPFAIGAEVDIRLSLKGTTVSVAVDGHELLGHVFNAVVVDGQSGLLSRGGESSFDVVEVRTDDMAFFDPAGEGENLLAAEAALAQPTGETQLSEAMLTPIIEEAIERWRQAVGLDAAALALLATIEVQVADLGGLLLGQTSGNTVLIDIDGAGHGWFVDTTPDDDAEFQIEPGDGQTATADSPAADSMDLLSVVIHELGHLLGLEAHELLGATLDAGERVLPEEQDGLS